MQIELDPELGSIGRGRRWVVRRAEEQGLSSDATRVVELLTSELVTNAVKYGPPGQRICLSTRRSRDEVRVAVADHGSRLPVVRTARPSDVGGRGIQLVDMLATAWGVERRPRDGKVVWFTLQV